MHWSRLLLSSTNLFSLKLLEIQLDLYSVTPGDEERLQVRGEKDGPSEGGSSQWPLSVQEAGTRGDQR